jgi:serine protease Do
MKEHDMQSENAILLRRRRAKAIIAVAVLLVLIGAGIGIGYWWAQQTHPTITPRQQLNSDGNKLTTATEDTIAAIADKVSPGVVSIVTNVTTRTLFGPTQAEAAGTGIVVSRDGYILTNKHVVSEANAIEVVMADGTTYSSVELVGTDPLNDVAFLKVNGVSNLSPAELGDSSTVRVGQEVVAIGNSLGQYQTTVTSGIISGKGRPIQASDGAGATAETLVDLLQTDAAINPGNSGGPLLNRAGQVIGINTAVAANAQGIGFAIPINATKGALKSVLAGKGVQRAYLGMRYVALTAATAKKYDVSSKQGAYIFAEEGQPAIIEDSPAQKAGLKEKDVVTKINGLAVGSEGGVSSLIGEYAPGDTVELTVLRGGKEIVLKATLGSYSR